MRLDRQLQPDWSKSIESDVETKADGVKSGNDEKNRGNGNLERSDGNPRL
jgi:hypothetical protein